MLEKQEIALGVNTNKSMHIMEVEIFLERVHRILSQSLREKMKGVIVRLRSPRYAGSRGKRYLLHLASSVVSEI